jgi:hypothetical protein
MQFGDLMPMAIIPLSRFISIGSGKRLRRIPPTPNILKPYGGQDTAQGLRAIVNGIFIVYLFFLNNLSGKINGEIS